MPWSRSRRRTASRSRRRRSAPRERASTSSSSSDRSGRPRPSTTRSLQRRAPAGSPVPGSRPAPRESRSSRRPTRANLPRCRARPTSIADRALRTERGADRAQAGGSWSAEERARVRGRVAALWDDLHRRALGSLPGFVDLDEVQPAKAATPRSSGNPRRSSRGALRQILQRVRERSGSPAGYGASSRRRRRASSSRQRCAPTLTRSRSTSVRDGREVATSLLERGRPSAERTGADDAGLRFGPYARFWVEPAGAGVAGVSDATRVAGPGVDTSPRRALFPCARWSSATSSSRATRRPPRRWPSGRSRSRARHDRLRARARHVGGPLAPRLTPEQAPLMWSARRGTRWPLWATLDRSRGGSRRGTQPRRCRAAVRWEARRRGAPRSFSITT